MFSRCYIYNTRYYFKYYDSESLEHNQANISETICPEMLVFGK